MLDGQVRRDQWGGFAEAAVLANWWNVQIFIAERYSDSTNLQSEGENTVHGISCAVE